MSIFDPREITAEQAGPLFNVALGHPLLQPEAPDCVPNIHQEGQREW